MNLSSRAKPGEQKTHIVSGERAATTLLQPGTIDLLRPFMNRALTVSEASATLNETLAKLHYRIKKLAALDLLEVAETFAHKGRERKRYRATAERFFVPFRVTKANDLKSFLRDHDAQWYEPMLDAYVKSLQQNHPNLEAFGIGLHLDEHNLFKFSLANGPERSAKAHDSLGIDTLWDTGFYLNHKDVAAMQQEVKDVLAKYRQKQSGTRYLVRFAYAPWSG